MIGAQIRNINDKKLLRKVKRMKIIEKLDKANKKYYALSPRWEDNIVGGEVIFWLNPMMQDENNFGWFKEGDLLDWIENKGVIPKNR